MEDPIKILIVDDHNLVRKGLIALLGVKPGVEVIGEACDGEEAVAMAKKLNPDVILLDLAMPNKDGISALKEIIHDNKEAKVLILTSFSEDDKIRAALDAGAHGFQLKDSTPAELLTAIQAVHQGQYLFHAKISRHLVHGFNEPAPDYEELTERELTVLELLAKGCTNQEIADLLSISDRTVSTHVTHILAKLRVENRTQAALLAVRIGLVTGIEE
jgi:two-component system, NarL family, response regulator LiaR